MAGADFRFCCLVGAVGVYALFGSPTPNAPGWSEALIAIFLCLAVGVPGVYNVLKPASPRFMWKSAGRALLIYGLCISLPLGILNGQDGVHIIRDMTPFLFFLLPLFLHDIFDRRPDAVHLFLLVLIVLGLAFSFRAVPEVIGWWQGSYVGELYYFSNAPSVLFAGILLVGFGVQNFIEKFSPRSLFLFSGCFFLALVPLAAVVFSLQRASFGAFLLAMVIFLAVGVVRSPARGMFLISLLFLVVLSFFPVIAQFMELMVQKTGDVGFNSRFEEIAAVWGEIAGSPMTVLFGSGWGGMFESPAVAGIRVNYTHSLLSAMILKTGIFGFGLTLCYLVGLTVMLVDVFRRDVALFLALAAPFLIDVFLYASYKSLDFGLILVLVAVSAPSLKVALQRRVLYSHLYNRLGFK